MEWFWRISRGKTGNVAEDFVVEISDSLRVYMQSRRFQTDLIERREAIPDGEKARKSW